MTRRAKHRGGAPRKAPEGLDRVIYTRADVELVERLDRFVEAWRQRPAHRTMTRSDAVRMLLDEALKGREPAP